MAAARSGAEAAEAGGQGGSSGSFAAGASGRAQLFSTVVDTFLRKLVEAGSYQRFADCYHCFYKLQPLMTRSIYDQFISQLQVCIQEEIQEVKEEGNLERLLNSLDKIVEETENRVEPAWRPSGVPEDDVRSAVVPYLLKHRSYLRKVLRHKEEENGKAAQSVLAGRERIAQLQQLIQARKHAWQAISNEQRELIRTFPEPQGGGFLSIPDVPTALGQRDRERRLQTTQNHLQNEGNVLAQGWADIGES